jgi:hypothetical protein
MKKLITLSIILYLMAGCGEDKQSSDELITVDVTANYPKKELILQDFMDVEYIPLETTDEFLTQGFVQDVGKDIIAARNRTDDGDIFIFDRKTGKALRKINRKGQGGEEYTSISGIILDENNHEMFVEDSSARKIRVYDLYGNFKRSFGFTDTGYYTATLNYDRDHLISYMRYGSGEMETKRPRHLLISKQDGSITREIEFPFKEIKTMTLRIGEAVLTHLFYPTIPAGRDHWILMNTSSDTLYACLPDGTISPFMVRTPSILSMETELFLFPAILTDRYYLMKTVKKEYDLETMKGFPTTDLLYDKQEKTLFNYMVYNNDFSENGEVFFRSKPVNYEIAAIQSLDAFYLLEVYEEGRLKGRLKEIAATLDEESNPVIMLIKHKKK